MREAVIVSTARTPIGRAFKGALNNIKSPTLLGHAIQHAVQRSGVDPQEIQDVVAGAVLTAGTAGGNLARTALLAAGLPDVVSGQTLDRQCASGLMAIATAAKQVIVDGMDVVVGAGQDNISAVQGPYMKWVGQEVDPNVLARSANAYMPMLQTAEFVAQKYKVSRDLQDEYSYQSQMRTAAAQEAGRLDAEIVPITTTMAIADKQTGATQNLGPLFPPSSSYAFATGEGWYFSHTLPHALYINDGPRLHRFDVRTRAFTPVFDVTTRFGANRYIWQVHSSGDDRVHSATLRDSVRTRRM